LVDIVQKPHIPWVHTGGPMVKTEDILMMFYGLKPVETVECGLYCIWFKNR